jgi:archaellum component FlaC
MENNLVEIVKDYKNRSNKDLVLVMEKINSEFEETKKIVINLSKHLDRLEKTYNDILSEYKNRTNG